MLCQNCRKNEANMHMKRIINGRAAEVHLCSDCARSLGYGEAFSGLDLSFGSLLGDLLLRGDGSLLPGAAVRCPLCSKTFEEIAETGKIGCAECYNTFYDKLLPSLNKIHGKAEHAGKAPLGFYSSKEEAPGLEFLRKELSEAVEAQDFERAALIRDRINNLIKGGAEE